MYYPLVLHCSKEHIFLDGYSLIDKYNNLFSLPSTYKLARTSLGQNLPLEICHTRGNLVLINLVCVHSVLLPVVIKHLYQHLWALVEAAGKAGTKGEGRGIRCADYIFAAFASPIQMQRITDTSVRRARCRPQIVGIRFYC